MDESGMKEGHLLSASDPTPQGRLQEEPFWISWLEMHKKIEDSG
jgi:hypothetical protein